MKAAKICKFSTLKYFFLNLFNCSLAYDFPLCICVFVVAPGHALIYVPSAASKSMGPPSFRNFFVSPASLLFAAIVWTSCKLLLAVAAVSMSCVLSPLAPSHTPTHTQIQSHSAECVWLWPLLIATPQQIFFWHSCFIIGRTRTKKNCFSYSWQLQKWK